MLVGESGILVGRRPLQKSTANQRTCHRSGEPEKRSEVGELNQCGEPSRLPGRSLPTSSQTVRPPGPPPAWGEDAEEGWLGLEPWEDDDELGGCRGEEGGPEKKRPQEELYTIARSKTVACLSCLGRAHRSVGFRVCSLVIRVHHASCVLPSAPLNKMCSSLKK